MKILKISMQVLLALMVTAWLVLAPAGKVSAYTPPQGLPASVTYNLYATDGFISLADGTVAYTYGFVGGRANEPIVYQNSVVAPPGAPRGFVPGGLVQAAQFWPQPISGVWQGLDAQLAGNAQFPAPVIYATTADVVQINLKNLGVTNRASPNDPHTIHLHGLDVDAANDGVPETSVAAVPANLARTPGAGNIVVYYFTMEKEGTSMYHCHQEADIHVQMGMYGALVAYNPLDAAAANGGPGKGFGGTAYGWAYDKDYILLLSEFDMGQHKAEQFAGTAGGYNPVNYRPQYWFINGLSFPNTLHAGIGFVWANWIAAHPNYDPFISGSVYKLSSAGTTGEKVLLRVINMGFEAQPMHMHGFHGKILGSDQRAWPWANTPGVTPSGEGMEKNTLLIGSGETYEWLLDFGTQTLNNTYQAGTQTQPGTQTRYDPLTNLPALNTDLTKPAIPDMFAPGFAYTGGPVVGPDNLASQGPGGLPPELPYTTGQYFPFHNHDDYKATNNGVYPGGMFTMIMTTNVP